LVSNVRTTTAATLMAALDARASVDPDRVVFTFLRDGELESGSLTYGQLRERALAIAAGLKSQCAAGSRAILLYPQGLEFPVALFGCFYAGVVGIPASVPSRKKGVDVLRRIAADSGATRILSAGPLLEQLREDLRADSGMGEIGCLDTAAWVTSAPWAPTAGLIEPGSIALLQYTSGSTGWPRGVAVTHTNLVVNQRHIQQSFDHDETTVFVSWLPMFHDMGLGGVLQTMWVGGRCVLMSPQAFLQSPARWLKAISTYRATTSGGPDFAYELCVRRVVGDERKGLDLTEWRVACNGSEPVRATTIERFSEAFAPSGFRRRSFHPVYGLAEATLLVTSEDPNTDPVIESFSATALEVGRGEVAESGAVERALVSCGHPWPGLDLTIVDPETHEQYGVGRVGEIWVRGPNVAVGYWGKDAETAASFGALTADGKGPFLRTGDLGFVHDGRLFVTGRHKDLVIIRGRNHYPQDIEASVSECHPALVKSGCAAFSIDGADGELLVVVQEVSRSALRTLDPPEVIRAIRRSVSEEHALQTHAVVLVKPSTIPRTTSGKLRHSECRRAFLDQSLPSVASWLASTAHSPDTDADPDSRGREGSARAERLIDWLRRHAADLISSHADSGPRTVPAPLLRNFAQQGLLGMQVDPRYGGLGLGHRDAARVLEQLAAFDFALAVFVAVNNHLGIQPVARHASAELRALLLPGLVHGEELAAFAFQEPGLGNTPSGLASRASVDGEERWRLFGTKYLEGVQQGASVLHVFAHHDEPPGISGFVVSEGIDGVRQLREGLSIGVLGIHRETVVLDGVRVGRENLLGGLGAGLDIAREAMTHTRLAIAAACVGGMKRCALLIGDGLPFDNIDMKLTPNPVTLSRLGSVTARLDALECLVHRTARAIDAGHAVPSEAFAACRTLGPELLLRSVDDLTQLGIRGSQAETNRVMCLYRDAGLLRHLDGSPEVVAERTGAAVMESDASLRLLVEEVFCAPEVVGWIQPVLEAVRRRMTTLRGPLARRAQRWGHTRAGELTTWLVLLAAAEGSLRTSPTAEIKRACAWARAQLEDALSSIRLGTPSESATLDTSDVAATFAAYSRTIGDLDPDRATSGSRDAGSWDQARTPADTRSRPSAEDSPDATESSRRELRSWIVYWLARRLQIPVSQVEAGRSFADHGLDSVASVELAKALSDKLRVELEETLLWNFATIDALVDHIFGPSADPWASAPGSERTPAASPRAPTREVESQLDDEIARLEQKLRTRS
jgi:acyl-CoA synthetase (AMP-forming)/AMP-acid ligase II/alkylation response protein AidB-like acyl-CoA dehydrogenase/acyl carrier protein